VGCSLSRNSRAGARLGPPALILALAILPGLIASAAAEPEAVQQRALDLWAAGLYAEATAAFQQLNVRFPDHRRGKAAYAHLGNLYENERAVEAVTAMELRDVLLEARRFYRIAATGVPDQEPSIRSTAMEGLRRVEGKLRYLEEVLAGRAGYVEGAETLSDYEAPAAAVDWLRNFLNREPSLSDHILFLTLVHQTDYIDALVRRLTDAYAGLREREPALFEAAYARFVPLIHEAIESSLETSASALVAHPQSPHGLDYHVYRGEAHRYRALLSIARRDWALERGEADAVAQQEAAVIRDLRLAIAENEAILQASERPAPPFEAADLHRYREMAEERLLEIRQLLIPFEAPQPAEPDPLRPGPAPPSD